MWSQENSKQDQITVSQKALTEHPEHTCVQDSSNSHYMNMNEETEQIMWMWKESEKTFGGGRLFLHYQDLFYIC